MAIFHRSSKYADATLVGKFGTVNVAYAGYFIYPVTVTYLGIVFTDNEIFCDVYADLTPNMKLVADNSPAEEIYLVLSPALKVQTNVTPSEEVYL